MTADRHAFFKYMAKSIAEKHGLRATFMPKPFVESHRLRLPRPRFALATRRQEPVRRRATANLAVSQLGYHFHRRDHPFGGSALRLSPIQR